jgi:membrane protease YdiL (CAAX protease family)
MKARTITLGGVSFDLQLTLIIILGTVLPMIDYYDHPVSGTRIYSLLLFFIVLPLLGLLLLLHWAGIRHYPRRTLYYMLPLLVLMFLLRMAEGKAYDRVVLYFVIPFLIILLLFREFPDNYGFRWGKWRKGLLYTLAGCGGMAILLWFIARTPGMQSFYEARAPESALYLVYITGVDLFGWEFVWRGFMLYGLARVLGAGPAIFLQAVPFAFMHLGKPEIETFSTIFGGAAFGFVAWQTRSFAYPFFIHWFIASFTQLIASGKLG